MSYQAMEAAQVWHSILPCFSCCQQFWLPSLARFGDGCLGIVAQIPTWVSLTLFLWHYSITLLPRGLCPASLQAFAAESSVLLENGGGDNEGVPLRKKFTWWTLSLIVLYAATAFCSIVYPPFTHVPVLPSIFCLVILLIDRPTSLPFPILIINTMVLLTEVAILASLTDMARDWAGMVWLGCVLPSATVFILLCMPLRDGGLKSEEIGIPSKEPTSKLRSPEDAISLWQWMTVTWMAPLISLGYQRQVHPDDVWLLPYDFQHTRLHSLFLDLQGSVLARLLRANGRDLLFTTVLGIVESLAEMVEPLFLMQLLAGLQRDRADTRVALVYTALTLLGRMVKAQSGVFSLWFSRRCYERSRGEMITMIYEKTLRRKAFTFPDSGQVEKIVERAESGSSSSRLIDNQDEADAEGDRVSCAAAKSFKIAWLTRCFSRKGGNVPAKAAEAAEAAVLPTKGPASTGKILNLMRNDAYEVSQRFWEFPSLITTPLNLIISLVLIWNILGPSSLLGISIVVAGQLINALLIRWLLEIERLRRSITDTKLQRISQFVEAIRHLRWYDWQESWLAHIFESRQAELSKRLLSNLLRNSIGLLNSLTSYMFPVAGFVAYTLISEQPLTVDIAFPALSLFGELDLSMRRLPYLVSVLLNAKVAMDRIENFMAEANKEDVEDDLLGPPQELEIELKDASFSWPGTNQEVLKGVSIVCHPGLTVVCGKVGIGKTALLQAMLGELDQHDGGKGIAGEMVGYCAQSPWLQSMSIRENILFSAGYDKTRYQKVLEACCLIPDLDNFKAKDLSLIGENGVGLSGGQKARVALARAIYSQARILLLDDPIAALDHDTAEAILWKLFGQRTQGKSGLLSGRLVVFVTHRVDLIAGYADQVLEVVDGGTVKSISREDVETDKDLEHLIASTPVPDEEGVLDESTAMADKFMDDEHRAHGGIMASVYWQYIKAGGLTWWLALAACFILFRTGKILYWWYLKEWGEGYKVSGIDYISTFFFSNQQLSLSERPLREEWPLSLDTLSAGSWIDLDKYLPSPKADIHPWLLWFGVISVLQVVCEGLSNLVMLIIVYKAGKRLFRDTMRRVSNATFRFYDVTPVGRLMNRLTSDMGTIDGGIANMLQDVAWYSITWLSSVFVIASATPIFLLLCLLMSALFVTIFLRFLPLSQSLRRLEMVSLTPLMSNFGTLLDGLTTVRAFKAQAHFQKRIIATTDAFQQMDHFYWSLQAWLQYRFDMLSALSTFALALTAIFSGLSSGTVGFVLSAAGSFVQSTHLLCRRYGELQMQFVSVERVMELLKVEQETEGRLPPAAWPAFTDDIEFDKVTLRYAPHLDPSLVDVSFRIPAGSSVAVTGRTGSGKSTLALSLLGTLPLDRQSGGSIHIGGVDLAMVDKHALRRAISFVAQDPVLFPGTLRDNLDPLHEHGDEECESVLGRVLPDLRLPSKVDGGGKNLSQGQRQLVGLGRAILRRSPVVILDEATASIDATTAADIQEVLRKELAYSTVITIAHRVEAVKDADYEVVMEGGRVLRCGPVERHL